MKTRMIDLKSVEEFDSLRKNENGLFVLVGSLSCLPCQALKVRIEQWLIKHPDVKGIYISRDWFLELTAQNNIFSVPTVVFYRQGKEQFRQSGYFSLDHILEKAETILQM